MFMFYVSLFAVSSFNRKMPEIFEATHLCNMRAEFHTFKWTASGNVIQLNNFKVKSILLFE